MTKKQSPRQFAVEVVERLRAAGYEALWAGGCVRDQLLERTPKDYDVATSAHPEQIRGVFGRRRTLPIGAAFGVITVLGPKSAGSIEVATFRQDATYSDGRHPDSVTFSTAEEDARRRDFTINGLFYDPLKQEVIDYVGGQLDIARRVVRAIGDPYERIAEDKLRMLRAVRFSATFDFELDEQTATAIQRQAHEIAAVSAERISDELRRMLAHGGRVKAARLLRDTKLLEQILPESMPGFGSKQSVWQETLEILARLREPTFPISFAVLVRNIYTTSGDKQVRQICRRLKLSNEETDTTLWLLVHEKEIRCASKIPWPKLQRILIGERVNHLMAFTTAVAAIVDGNLKELAFCQEKLALPSEQLNPEPLLNGDDLKAAGIKPGPAFKRILESVRDAQLDGEAKDKGDGIRLARSLVEDI